MQPPHLPPSKHEAVLRWREFDGQTECRFKNLGDFLRTFQYHVSTAYEFCGLFRQRQTGLKCDFFRKWDSHSRDHFGRKVNIREAHNLGLHARHPG